MNRRSKIDLCETWLKSLEDEPPELPEHLEHPEHPEHSQTIPEDTSDNDRIIALRLKGEMRDRNDKQEGSKKQRLPNLKNVNPELTCEWLECKFSTMDYKSFQTHVISHEMDVLKTTDGNATVGYACLWAICKFSTSNEKELKRHVGFHAYHTKIKAVGAHIRDLVLPPRCDSDYSKRNAIPPLNSDFQCLWINCGMSFVYIQEFFDHVECHERGADLEEKRYMCSWLGCQYSAADRTRLAHHLMTHSKRRICACPHCGTMYWNTIKFLDHLDRQMPVIEQDYQCSQCNKLFPTEKLMKDHIFKHINFYQCPFCEMTTHSTSSMSLHIQDRHINTKPFNCPHCTYKTTRKFTFNNHMKTVHMGIKFNKNKETKIYACHCCDVRYKCCKTLSAHLRTSHNYNLPPGFTKFRYVLHMDGLYKLQQVRYESIEMLKQPLPEDTKRRIAENTEIYSLEQYTNLTGGGPAVFQIHHENADDQELMTKPQKGKRKRGSSKIKHSKKSKAKTVEISIHNLDADGNVVKTEIVQTEQIGRKDLHIKIEEINEINSTK